MEDISNELLKALPLMPDAEFDCWAMRQPRMQQHAIVYRVAYVPEYLTGIKQKMIECRCSACEGVFFQGYAFERGKVAFLDDNFEIVKDGDTLLCPDCGAEVTAVHVSRAGSTSSTKWAWFCRFTKILGHAAMIMWKYQMDWTKDGRRVVKVYPYEAFVFAGRKTYFFRAWYKYFNTYTQLNIWEKHNFRDYYGKYDTEYIFPVKDDYFVGTSLENAKLERFLRESRKEDCYLIQYIRTFLKHQQIENIVMAGASRLVNGLIEKSAEQSYYYKPKYRGIIQGVNWKEKAPAKMLGLTKPELGIVVRERWGADMLDYFMVVKASAFQVKAEDFKNFIAGCGRGMFLNLSGLNVSPEKCVRYVRRQKEKYKKEECDLITLWDYYDAARKLGYNMADDAVLFPKNMVKEHDRLVGEYNRLESKEEAKDYIMAEPRFDKLANAFASFAWERDGLCIRIAAKPEELLLEGKTLHHCVARYIDKHAKGEECIFFVRKSDCPETSFYTLELDMKTLQVLQNRGKQNCARTPEVEAFEAEWLEYIKSLRIRKAG